MSGADALASAGAGSDNASGGSLLAGAPIVYVLRTEVDGLALGQGDRGELVVRAEDLDGDPVKGLVLSFSLSGQALDSGLLTLSATTGADGRASNAVLSGVMQATFDVQVNIEGAESILIPVMVHPMGFGSLVALAPYAGQHMPQTRQLSVYANGRCDDLAADSASSTNAMLGAGQDSASFFLPAGMTYAVLATALGPEGIMLASACTDDVAVEVGEASEAVLDFVDTPLIAEGDFDLVMQLDATDIADVLADRINRALMERVDMVNVVTPAQSEASFLLAALSRTLQAASIASVDEQDLLTTEIETGTITEAVQSRLDQSGQGPRAAVDALTAEVRSGLGVLTLQATLFLPGPGGKSEATLSLVSLSGGPADDPDTVATVPLDEEPASVVTLAHDPLAGTLTLSDWTPALPLASVATQTLKGAVATDTDTGASNTVLMGCDALFEVFESWASEMAPAVVCDDACKQATCDRAFANLVTAAQLAMAEMMSVTPTTSASDISVTMQLLEETGDLLPDALSGDDLTARVALEGDASTEVVAMGSLVGQRRSESETVQAPTE